MSSKDSIESQAADDKTIRGEHVWTSSFEEIRVVYHFQNKPVGMNNGNSFSKISTPAQQDGT